MSDLDQLPLPAQADVATQQQQQQQQQASTQHHHPHQHRHQPQDTSDMTTPAPPPPPPLEPFFTLVTNTTSATTIHPRVQYLFSDDDLSAITANQLSSSSLPSSSTRSLVVDLIPTPDNTSWSVSWASSLSPDFALTSSCITVQPDGGGGGGNNSDDNDNGKDVHKDSLATLRLEGVERDPPDASRSAGTGTGTGSLPSSGSGTALGREDVDALADEFRRRIAVLRKVVGESEKRRMIIEEAEAQSHAQNASSPSPHGQDQDQDQQQVLLDDPSHRPRRSENEDTTPVAVREGQDESPGADKEDPVRGIPPPGEFDEAVGSTWG
ncbi:hypothetical protein E4U43_006701 [Claviceps pusilla]|uniref:Uncharacterized protein n=1 Tax=Claviceps pusilla TaxID=123648 RepID=A0A9P7N334_9HYPO|nr:hypothetical protein E4U43_006701 [Claviceps pusilla]